MTATVMDSFRAQCSFCDSMTKKKKKEKKASEQNDIKIQIIKRKYVVIVYLGSVALNQRLN